MHEDKSSYKKILCEISLQDANINHIYQQPEVLTNWNVIRENLFNHIEDKLLKQIMEKGLKKPYHKELIQNNYGDFNRFFERKIRYLITHYNKQGKFNDLILNFNVQLQKEIELNIDNLVQSTKNEMKARILNINKQIKYMLENDFVDLLYGFLIKDRDFLDNILNYISEFIYYLVMF